MGTWRLILAWMVIAEHTNGVRNFLQLEIGEMAISTFFFISGFLMPLTYDKHYSSSENRSGILRFYLNRALRIYPVYWASLFIVLLGYYISFLTQKQDRLMQIGFSTYVQNFCLLSLNQSKLWGGYDRFNNPAWTLDVELQYYLLVPLLVLAASSGKKTLLSGLVILSIGSLWLFFWPLGLVDIDRSFLAWAVFFIMGFSFYQATVQKNMCYVLGVGLLVAGGLLVAAGLEKTTTTLLITMCLIAASSVLLVMHKNYKFGSLDGLAGDLSYPTYILHIVLFPPIIVLLRLLPLSSLGEVEKVIFIWLLNVVVSTAAGYIALKLIIYPIDRFRVKIRSNSN